MKNAYLSSFDRNISVISFGGSLYGDVVRDSTIEQNYKNTLLRAIESGVNYIDSAKSYWNGRHEEFLGELKLPPHIMLGTKSDLLDRQGMIDAVEESRHKLKRDCIDIYYIHWPKTGTEIVPAVEALEECRSRGWIGGIGLSNFSVAQIQEAQKVGKIDIVQLGYNLIWRVHEEDLLPFCSNNNIDTIVYSPIAQGILTGKFPKDIELGADDARQGSLFFRADVWPHIYQFMSDMQKISKDLNRSAFHIALQWLLSNKNVTSILLGVRNVEQWLDAERVFETNLLPKDQDEIDKLYFELSKYIPKEGNIFQYYP